MRSVLHCLVVTGLAACGSPLASTVQDFAADQILPVEQEIELGDQLAVELAAELTMHPDESVQAYISELGAAVVAVAADRDPAIEFRFHVVQDDETVNAFAIPGGHIYMYTGLLLAAESEAEVMAVLAHEVAHVTQRHVAERVVATYGIEVVLAMALGEDPGAVSQLVSQVVGTGAMLSHSRSAEIESDRVGFDYLVDAGYDPHGFIDFFSKLETSGRQPEFISTHPAPNNRIAAIEALISRRDDWPDLNNVESYLEFRTQL